MVIEFCGVPGGGKSTLFRAYQSAHPETKAVALDMYNKAPTAWYAGLYLLFHPVSFFSLTIYVKRHHAPGLFWYSLHLMLRACAKWQKASSSRKRTVLLDEGLLHILAVLPAHAVSADELSRMLSRLPLPETACITADGSFHRFHNSEAHKHPRVVQGSERLTAWEAAVRTNVVTLHACLVRMKVPVFIIPAAPAALDEFLKAL